MPRETKLAGDITLAVALIAAEFGVDIDKVPDGVATILRSFSAAHYNAGVRDTMVRLGNHRSRAANEPVPSTTSETPIVGPYGRRLRRPKREEQIKHSDRPTPMIPPPLGVIKEEDDE